ncbi:MAG: hypothetical protein R8M14_04565 [Ghiorsea sp.]
MKRISKIIVLLCLSAVANVAYAEKYKVLDWGNFNQFWGLGVGGNLGGDLNAPDGATFPPSYYENDSLRHLNFWVSGVADYYFKDYAGFTASFHYGRSLEQLSSEASDKVVGDLNSPLHLEAGIYWYLMNDTVTENRTFVLDSSSIDIGNKRFTTTTSMGNVPHVVQTIVAGRGGMYYDQGNSVFNSYKVDVNYNFVGTYLGLAYIENVSSTIDILEGEHTGTHSNVSSTQYYADFIVGSSTVDLVYDTASGATPTIIAGSEGAKPDTVSGWRIGNKVEWENGLGTDIQMGRMPGYFDNFYISADVYYGFDFDPDISLDSLASKVGLDI